MTKYIYYVFGEFGEFICKTFSHREAKQKCRSRNYKIEKYTIS